MKKNTKTYKGLSYRQIQSENSRKLDDKDVNKNRKKSGLSNRGWKNVVDLYEWLISRLGGLKGKSKEYAAIMNIAAEMKASIDSCDRIFDELLPPRNVIIFPTLQA